MKILGIGNAIVDVLCKVSDDFLKKNSLKKSTMKLMDEIEFKKLISSVEIDQTVSGGSVANSIVGLSQLGNKVGFIGKINNDSLGKKYEDGLLKENVKFLYERKDELISTGSCLILITPDSERTMCTYLGIAGKISDQDISIQDIKNSDIVFLEGYLWDQGDPKKAFDKAILNSKTNSMSLSDIFCVERHKKDFLELVINKLDIIFANEQEILSLISSSNFNDAINFGKEIKKNLVITRGNKGATAIYQGEVFECKAKKNLNIKDLTGAGDLFAAGYLHGIINNMSINECLDKGTELSSKIIQKIGARI
jgi:fructokinase